MFPTIFILILIFCPLYPRLESGSGREFQQLGGLLQSLFCRPAHAWEAQRQTQRWPEHHWAACPKPTGLTFPSCTAERLRAEGLWLHRGGTCRKYTIKNRKKHFSTSFPGNTETGVGEAVDPAEVCREMLSISPSDQHKINLTHSHVTLLYTKDRPLTSFLLHSFLCPIPY